MRHFPVLFLKINVINKTKQGLAILQPDYLIIYTIYTVASLVNDYQIY